MGQVASYVAQKESRNEDPNYYEKDSRVCQKYKRKSMLEFIFGWSEASKCKKVIKQTHFHLNELKNRRFCIVKQLRDDTEKLIKSGEFEMAFERVGQVYKDECIVAVYDLLAQFCERIYFHLSHIRRNKSCPKDVIEAISSLIFASARCGNLPELLYIRRLFSRRYGRRLETEAVNLLPGNNVNIQIIEKLSIDKVSDEVKYKLLKEINKSNMNQSFSANTTKEIGHIDVSVNPLDRGNDSESTSDSSTKNIYEDIQEFKSPIHNGIDQSGFLFISSPRQISDNIHIENFQISTRRHSVSSADYENKMPLSTRRCPVSSALEQGMSLPCERTTTPLDENSIQNSYSIPPSSPHVHPKLPEYDVIQAMFMDLKKQNLLNRKQLSTHDRVSNDAY